MSHAPLSIISNLDTQKVSIQKHSTLLSWSEAENNALGYLYDDLNKDSGLLTPLSLKGICARKCARMIVNKENYISKIIYDIHLNTLEIPTILKYYIRYQSRLELMWNHIFNGCVYSGICTHQLYIAYLLIFNIVDNTVIDKTFEPYKMSMYYKEHINRFLRRQKYIPSLEHYLSEDDIALYYVYRNTFLPMDVYMFNDVPKHLHPHLEYEYKFYQKYVRKAVKFHNVEFHNIHIYDVFWWEDVMLGIKFNQNNMQIIYE
jgi:hypothetical protein